MEKAKWVVAAVAFVNALCYSACFPSLAPFAERLSGITAPTAGTASLLGVIVALFPLSKAATAPLAGRAAARFGIRATLLVQQAVLIVGSVVYATAATTGMLCTSRVLLGIAASSSTVCRGWVSQRGGGEAARARATAALSGATTLGFCSGPLLGALLFSIDDEELAVRAPGALGALLGALLVATVAATWALDATAVASSAAEVLVAPTAVPTPAAAAPGVCALVALGGVQIGLTLPFASFEALVTPYAIDAFALSSPEVGLLFGGAAACSLVCTIAAPALVRRASAPRLLLAALAVACAACLCMVGAGVALFAASLVTFFGAYALSQTALFCVLNEKYRRSTRCAELLGWVGAAAAPPPNHHHLHLHHHANLHRVKVSAATNGALCVAPPAAVAMYNAGAAAAESAADAVAPIWVLDGLVVAAGALLLLLSWRELASSRGAAAAGAPSAEAASVGRARRERACRTVVVFACVAASYAWDASRT